MIRESHEATRPARLPCVDVPIQIRRDRGRLAIAEVEVPVDPRASARTPWQVRFVLDGELLGDELILVYEQAIDCSGPHARRMGGLILVEDVFEHPFVLSRRRPACWSGPPNVRFPRGVDAVGWCFGALLVRGDDRPYVGSSLLHFVREVS